MYASIKPALRLLSEWNDWAPGIRSSIICFLIYISIAHTKVASTQLEPGVHCARFPRCLGTQRGWHHVSRQKFTSAIDAGIIWVYTRGIDSRSRRPMLIMDFEARPHASAYTSRKHAYFKSISVVSTPAFEDKRSLRCNLCVPICNK